MAVVTRRTWPSLAACCALVQRASSRDMSVAFAADFTAPNVDRIADVTLEDHLDTLLTELAISLTTIEQAAGQASVGLRDGSAIQKVLSQRHGAQRASLGWREEDVGREVRALQGAIETELRTALGGSTEVDLAPALAVLANRLDFVERYSPGGMENANASGRRRRTLGSVNARRGSLLVGLRGPARYASDLLQDVLPQVFVLGDRLEALPHHRRHSP